MDIKTVIEIVTQAAEDYERKLRDRHFMVVYEENGEKKSVQFGFRDFNFLHLTGVKSSLSASRFYDACLKHRLSAKDITDFREKRKLAVIPYLSGLLYNKCMIGYSINNGVYLQADYFVGNTKAVLSLGFRCGKNIDYPVTLYNGDVRQMISPVCKVIAIFSKRYDEEEYSTCTYLAADVEQSEWANGKLMTELLRGRESGEEMGWYSLEEVELEL